MPIFRLPSIKGAVAVLCEELPEELKAGITYIQVKDSEDAVGKVATTFYGDPTSKMELIGVTGTNGKTTTTYLVKHMLEDAGHKVGLIGTNQNLIGDEVIETERTTPESYELHAPVCPHERRRLHACDHGGFLALSGA